MTRILDRAQAGDPQAAAELLPLVYRELRRLAASRLSREGAQPSLEATELVHEAYCRLVGREDRRWDGRAHFFAAAAEAMRRILIDRARRHKAARHGGGQEAIDISGIELPSMDKSEELLAVHEALDVLAAAHPQKADLVKLRYFVGLTTQEAAEVLGISVPTADRWWRYCRAWLYEHIERERR